ncbi:MAG: hypothetical protein QXH81_09855 [Thermofilaceae archaeon]
MSRHLERLAPSSTVGVHAWKLNLVEGLVKRAEEVLLKAKRLGVGTSNSLRQSPFTRRPRACQRAAS